MKLYLSLFVTLSLLGSALSYPQDDIIDAEEFEGFPKEQIESDSSDIMDFEDSAAGQFSRDFSYERQLQSALSSMQDYDTDQSDDAQDMQSKL